jgi:hemerythrin superfamily protein
MATRSKPAQDAIALLKKDHKEVAKLFREFKQVDRDDTGACQAIVDAACAQLRVHTAVEEEIFYPAVRNAPDIEGQVDDLLNEAEVEHRSVKDLISRIEAMEPADPHYGATFAVIAEYVKHHVKEEEGEMFPQVKKAKIDLAELGEQMRARQLTLKAEMGIERPREEDEDEVELPANTDREDGRPRASR